MKKVYSLTGVDCPNCGQKIEAEIKKLDWVKSASYHFPTKRLSLNSKTVEIDEDQLSALILSHEPQAVLEPYSQAASQPQIAKPYPLYLALLLFLVALAIRWKFGTPSLFTGSIQAINGSHLPIQIVSLLGFALSYFLSSRKVYIKAYSNLRRAQFLDENVLMIIASVGAIFLGEYPEAVAVMLFFAWGEYFEDRAVDASRRSIEETMNIMPEEAVLLRDGEPVVVSPESLKVDDLILVRPGAKVPADGIIIDGSSQLDAKAITGESLPLEVDPGTNILSGCVNLTGLLTVKITRPYSESTVSRMLQLIAEASEQRSPTERFITRFARIYTPAIVLIAIGLAFIPPLAGLGDFRVWLYRALVFLVASCPCALVISVPLAYFAGLGAASRQGILVKGGNALEELAKAHTLVVDKTGTLTEGKFAISGLKPAPGEDPVALLQAAVIGETGSQHPLAIALRKSLQEVCRFGGCPTCNTSACGHEHGHQHDHDTCCTDHHDHNHNHDHDTCCHSKAEPASSGLIAALTDLPNQAFRDVLHKLDLSQLESTEYKGRGIVTSYRGDTYLCGNARLMAEHQVDHDLPQTDQTSIYVAKNGRFLGVIYLADAIKSNAAQTVKDLHSCRVCDIRSVVMLTGDKSEVAKEVSAAIGIDRFEAELLPEDKLDAYNRLDKQDGSRVFIGDGINDAPVLIASDVGIAMGGIGQAAAIEAADVIIANDNLAKFHQVLHIARKTHSVVRQNIGLALGIKFLVLLLGALGLASMWAAVFADVGVTLIAVINSLRILKTYPKGD